MKARFARAAVLACLVVLLACGAAQALTIAAGVGYCRPVSKLAGRFQIQIGVKVDLVFANMGQIMGQIKAGVPIDLMLGDKAFLDQSGLTISAMAELGQGRLVLARAKGVNLESPHDLLRPEIKRVAMPDQAEAIYGKAGQCRRSS